MKEMSQALWQDAQHEQAEESSWIGPVMRREYEENTHHCHSENLL